MYAPTRTFCSSGIDKTSSLNFACSEWLHQFRWQLEFDFLFTARHRRDIDGPQCAQRIDYVLHHLFRCRSTGRDADGLRRFGDVEVGLLDGVPEDVRFRLPPEVADVA